MDRVVVVQPSVYGTDNACTLDAIRQLGSRARGVAVIDNATPADPHALSTGIAKVWVNGKLAYEGGKTTGARGGMVVRGK